MLLGWHGDDASPLRLSLLFAVWRALVVAREMIAPRERPQINIFNGQAIFLAARARALCLTRVLFLACFARTLIDHGTGSIHLVGRCTDRAGVHFLYTFAFFYIFCTSSIHENNPSIKYG